MTNNSKAHIIPNALGGRLAPRGLICKTCNTKLDKVADNALINAFGEWPTLLILPRQKGQNPPQNTYTKSGEKVRINPDGSFTKTDAIFNVTPRENGNRVHIEAGNIKTAKQLIKKAKKKFPQIDTEEVERHLQKVPFSLDEGIAIQLDFSIKNVIGGVLTAIWLYYLHATGRPIMDWNRLMQCIDSMKKNGGSFKYFNSGLPGLSGPSIDLGHKIVLRSVPATGDLIAYVEILNTLKVGGVFASGHPGVFFEEIYAYDLMGKAELSKQFYIDPITFNAQNWSTVGVEPTDTSTLKEYRDQAISYLVNCYYNLNK